MSQFDWKRPTVAMLGTFQPWQDEDTNEFKTIHKRTNQVVILVQESRTQLDFMHVRDQIQDELGELGFNHEEDYIVQPVPYITDFYNTGSKEYRVTTPE